MLTIQDITKLFHDHLDPLMGKEEVHHILLRTLEKVCQLTRVDFILNKNKELSSTDVQILESILKRLQAHEPIQYILEEAPFLDFDFYVNDHVLIPRPETEELVELIAKDVRDQKLTILDIGTGSGCIAISLDLLCPLAQTQAFDISEEALKVAQYNNDSLGAQVTFRHVDILTYEPDEATFDILVSNPPYICDQERHEMEAHVLNHEPHLALFVPDHDPLRFYRRIAQLGLTLLNPHGKLYYEINALYGVETQQMLEALGYQDVNVIQDLYGKDRFIKATHP